MKNDLIERLKPFVSKFVDDILKIHEEFLEKNKELEYEIINLKKERQGLKAQIDENNHKLKLEQDKLDQERAKQTFLNNQVKDEISKYNKLNSGLVEKDSKSQENLKSSEIEKQMISDSLERAKSKEIEYTNKLDYLKKDEVLINNRNADLTSKERVINTKEKVVNKKQDENSLLASKLNDLDLNLKAREAEVNRLIKRYKLEKFVGGN